MSVPFAPLSMERNLGRFVVKYIKYLEICTRWFTFATGSRPRIKLTIVMMISSRDQEPWYPHSLVIQATPKRWRSLHSLVIIIVQLHFRSSPQLRDWSSSHLSPLSSRSPISKVFRAPAPPPPKRTRNESILYCRLLLYCRSNPSNCVEKCHLIYMHCNILEIIMQEVI